MNKPIVMVRSVLAVTIYTLFSQIVSAQSTTDNGTLEKVVVTAEKRLSLLDKTPETISAISGATLRDIGAAGLQDLVRLVPNVSFSEALGASRINIRGIGANYVDAGVALYKDGIYMSDLSAASSGMFDLQRIEVMRGPQGALYGRNATGGAVNFVSAQPTRTAESQISAQFGNYGRKETEGFISGPLGDSPTSARLSFQLKKLDGFVSNTVSGQSYGPIYAGNPGNPGTLAPNRFDDADRLSVRLQTLSDFGDNGKLRLILNSFRQDESGQNRQVLPASNLNSFYLYGVLPGTDRFSTTKNGGYERSDLSSLQAAYERPIGNNTLSFSIGSRKSKYRQFNDGDSTALLLNSGTIATDNTDRSMDVNLASDDSGNLRWMVGATVLQWDYTLDNVTQQIISAKQANPALAATTARAASNTWIGGTQSSRASAFYLDLRYALNPELALKAGLRTSREEKLVNEFQQINALARRTAQPTADWSSTPGNVGLEWNPSKNTLVYGKLASGFKSGAINIGFLQATSIRPETVNSVEAGIKTSFMENRGSLSATMFSSSYKDMQMYQTLNGLLTLINAPEVKINGAEFELLVRPVPEWTLGANLGLLDPKFTKFLDINTRYLGAVAQDLNGKLLPNVSKTQFNLNAEYSAVTAGFKTIFRVDYLWRDKYYFTEFNESDVVQEAYGILNLSASIRPVGAKWKLFTQLKNVADTRAYANMTVGGSNIGGQRQVTYIAPRTATVGVQFEL